MRNTKYILSENRNLKENSQKSWHDYWINKYIDDFINPRYDTNHYYHDGYCLSPFTIFIHKGILYIRNFVGI